MAEQTEAAERDLATASVTEAQPESDIMVFEAIGKEKDKMELFSESERVFL